MNQLAGDEPGGQQPERRVADVARLTVPPDQRAFAARANSSALPCWPN
jgi:hypothetical protein